MRSLTDLAASGSTRVTSDIGIVRNGGSAFEAVTSFNNSPDTVGVQSLLQEIKIGLEGGQSVQNVVAKASLRGISDRAGTAKRWDNHCLCRVF